MSTTINLQVAAGADDTRENSGGACNHTATSTLQETAASVPAYGAFRWQANVPQGATIDSATLTLYPTNTLYDDPVTDIFGLDADTVAAWDSTSGEITAYTFTTATTAWDGTALGTGGAAITVTSIVQEIVNRAGWVANNYMAMVVKSDTGCNVRVTLYDGDAAEAPKLDITYTAVTGVPKQAVHYARMRS